MLTENSETEQKFLERSINTNSEIHNILCCLFLIQLVHQSNIPNTPHCSRNGPNHLVFSLMPLPNARMINVQMTLVADDLA